MSRILVVDDHEQNRYLLHTLLAASDHEVLEAANGSQALELARRAQPDLIISDILMPQMDGFALCRECKADERLRGIPFVFYTATYTDPRDRDFALQLGAARFVVKPMEGEAFSAVVGEVLEEYAAGKLIAAPPLPEGEAVIYRLYSEALVRKLEDKMLELDESNRALELEIAERKRSEAALRASEARYQLISTVASDYMFSTRLEADGRLQLNWVAGAFEGITGYTLEAYLARGGWRAAVHPDDLAIDDRDMETLRAGQRVVTELRTLTQSGQTRWVRVYAHPVLEAESRELVGIYGAVQDITERKQTEEALRRRLAELEAVSKISTALRAAQTLDEMLPVLLDETLAALESEAGAILLYHVEADELRTAAARGWFASLTGPPPKPGEGSAGTVFISGQAHVSREFVSDPLTRASALAQIPRGWGGLCLPIRAAGEVVGVVFVSVQLPREISPEEAKLLASLAEIAGTALHRLRLHDETTRRLRQLQALRAIDQAITSSLDARLILNILLEQVTAQLQVDAAGVLLFDPASLSLEYAAGRGFRLRAYEHSRLRLGEGLAGRAALEQRLVQTANLLDAPDFTRAGLLRGEHFVAHVVAPFIAKGQIKGVLEVFHRQALQTDAEWLDFLEALAGQATIAIDNIQLFSGLQRSNAELILAYDTTIEGWSRALDLRDKETEGHTLRVTEITLKLARAAGMSEDELIHVKRGALLHDIGKMGVPDAILLKPGPLTDDEWVVMRQHPQFAYDMLSPISYLRPALDIPYCHHEKWDGTGYPRGLKGEQIPLAARIFAVVDVWDALRSDRPYRKAWSEERVREYIRALAGTHFDPMAVELYFRAAGEGAEGSSG